MFTRGKCADIWKKYIRFPWRIVILKLHSVQFLLSAEHGVSVRVGVAHRLNVKYNILISIQNISQFS